MPDVEILITDLKGAVKSLTDKLAQGTLTPSEWAGQMQQVLTRYHTAAVMLGADDPDVTPAQIQMLKDLLVDQFGYLNGFKVTIQSAQDFEAGWLLRAQMYADAIKIPYWRGRTQMLPLPAMPAEGTQCLGNCKCEWEIETVDEGAGDYNCYWRRNALDSCETCLEREAEWNPLVISGGELQ